MAHRRSGGALRANWLVLLIITAIVIYSTFQLSGLAKSRKHSEDAGRLLYQVALFQIELLGNLLNEAGGAGDTGQLDGLKQSAYSANYTHERLMMAVGDDQLAPLQSVTQLQQYILRLQIGGNRPLKGEESELLRKAGETFKTLYDAYGKLLSSGGSVISSQNRKLATADRELVKLLRD